MGNKTSEMVRKLTILFTFLLWCQILPAPGRAVCYIERVEPINYYDPLIRAVVQVESRGDIFAYNPHEQATGAFQIRPIRLRDYNEKTGKNYTLDQMYNYEIAKSIFLYFTNDQSYELVAKDWNKSRTNRYWKLVKAEL